MNTCEECGHSQEFHVNGVCDCQNCYCTEFVEQEVESCILK